MSLSKSSSGFRSIRFRLAMLFVAIFGSMLVLFSSLLYKVVLNDQRSDFDVALYNHAVDISQGINFSLFGDLRVSKDLESNEGKIFPFTVEKTFLQIINPQGRVVARSANLGKSRLPIFPADEASLTKVRVAFRTLEPHLVSELTLGRSSTPYRMITYLVQGPYSESFILQVAAPLTFLSRAAHEIQTFFLITIPLTLVLATFGGLYLSRRAFAPVIAMIEKAKSIGSANLSERVPVPPVNDELQELSLTLNALLERLEQSFRSQERFVADASHELKTPLAILRGELDVLRRHLKASGLQPMPEVETFLGSASQELDHLGKMVEDLLTLARVDAGAASLSRQKVRVDELALESVSRLEPLTKAKSLTMRFDLEDPDHRGFEAQGDADLLASVFKNLIENAIKFSPSSGQVQLALRSEEEWIEISVKDQGPGLPGGSAGKVFERFFRGDSKAPGAGLGLTIARQIMRAHHGTLDAQSNPEVRGTIFTARLPRAEPS